MRILIPDIEQRLMLEVDWNFTLYAEKRNVKLAKMFGYTQFCHYWVNAEGVAEIKTINDVCKGIVFDYTKYDVMTKSFIENNPDKITPELRVKLEAGTELKVDRVYIRKGAKDFSSLSFFIKNGPYKSSRFWAKLNDVNAMIVKTFDYETI